MIFNRNKKVYVVVRSFELPSDLVVVSGNVDSVYLDVMDAIKRKSDLDIAPSGYITEIVVKELDNP